MTDQTRADFEAHFQLTTRQKWQHPDGSYQFPEIQAKWEGYLAGVAKAAPTEQEPVEYQHRMRATWRDEGEGWTQWEKCSAECYQDYLKAPLLHDWQHEVRKLYVAP